MPQFKLLVCTAVLTCCCAISDAARRPRGERPNIVFVLVDDMGWPDLGCYGHGFHETPVLDQLAADGMRFTDFYAATPVCSSTRSTIQTGQYSARTGITDFIPGHWRRHAKLVVPPIEHHLGTDITTPGQALQARGYATGYFGKWHLGNQSEHQPDHWGYQITARQLGEEFRSQRGTAPAGPKRIDLLTDQAIYFIEQHQDSPFFVTLSHYAVHIPLESHTSSLAKYEAKRPPDTGVNNPRYAAMVEDLDRSVGRLLDRLDALGLRNNTVVIVTSDNGGLRKTFTGKGEIVSTNAPLRDEKGSLYEGGIRVPMIVRWPAVVTAGSTCGVPATTADLLPTFCAIAGANVPAQPIDGQSLVAVLRGGDALDRDAIFFHYPHYHHSTPAGAVRHGNWKLIEFFESGDAELYDLADDLGETNNLASAHPARARELQQRLADWRTDVGARMPTANPEFDPALADFWWSRKTKQRIPGARANWTR